MAPKPKKTEQPRANQAKAPPISYATIGEKVKAEYLASRPLQVLLDSKGWAKFTAAEKTAYATFKLLESEAYLGWSSAQQKDFFRLCDNQNLPVPLPEPESLGKDRSGRRIEEYSLEEYAKWREQQEQLEQLKEESRRFKEWDLRQKRKGEQELLANPVLIKGAEETGNVDLPGLEKKIAKIKLEDTPITEEDYQAEKKRRVRIAELEGGKMIGIYEGDPDWDDVIPIPQDDGEKPLAAIAYAPEYSEAMSYLRALIASNERSPRALTLTAHIIDLNPAHYTVWLYRASILFALSSSITDELAWVNSIALANEKNYQIWHHRQLLIDNIYPTISSSREAILKLARSETDFMREMFDLDSKNYHVWSYRHYLVRKLEIFPSQCSDPDELQAVERLLDEDVRNNSAWSHRFFLVFSDPGSSTPGSKATEFDPKIPQHILDREIEFSKCYIRKAAMNQSGWNYLRGVLKKGGRGLDTLEPFAAEFVSFEGDEEKVTSSHALDFLADVWDQKGESEKADRALRLLGEKYDRIRKNYWEWRREILTENKTE